MAGFDVAGALKEGYSPAEIADYLGAQSKFDVSGARGEGYSDDEIISHLSAIKAPGIIDRIKTALTPDPDRAPMPSTADTINAPSGEFDTGATTDDSGRISMPGSVMDGFTPKENAQGMPIEAGMGPMRQSFYDETRAGLLSAPIQAHAKATQAGGQVGKVATDTLGGRAERLERELSGDSRPGSTQEFIDDVGQGRTTDDGRLAKLSDETAKWAEEFSKANPRSAEVLGGVMRTGGGVWGAASAILPEGSIPAQVADVSAQFADSLATKLQKQDFTATDDKLGWMLSQTLANAPSAALSIVGMLNPASAPLVIGALSASSGGGQYRKLIREGVDRDIATAAGVAYGVAEGIFERMELGIGSALIKQLRAVPIDVLASTGRRIMQGAAKGAAITTVIGLGESGEEIGTDLGQIATDVATGKAIESRTGTSKLTTELTNLDPTKVGNKLINAAVGGFAAGGMLGSPQIAIGAREGYQAGDLTSNMGYSQDAIDAAARRSLDPANAQLEAVATPADIAAATTPEAVLTAITGIGAGIAQAPISETLDITQAEIDSLLADPLTESAPLAQTPEMIAPPAIEAQPGPAAPGLLSGPQSNPFDDFLAQDATGRWSLSRPIANQAPEFVGALFDELDRRNSQPQGVANAQAPEAQQSPAPLQDVPQAAPETGTLPNQLTPAAADGVRKGEIGGMMESGEVVLTSSGRQTTAFPKIKSGPRSFTTTLKAVDTWLMQNALDEARSRGDEFNARQFEQNLAKPSQADKDSAEEYLFGQQPDVPKSILKPLVEPAGAAAPSAPRTYLDVPFKSKDLAKRHGAKWDEEKKLWYADKKQDGSIHPSLSQYIPQPDAVVRNKPTIEAAAINKSAETGEKYVAVKHPSIEGGWMVGKDESEPAAQTNVDSVDTPPQRVDQPAENEQAAKSITRIKGGKLEIVGFDRDEVADTLKTAKITATVVAGKDGKLLVSVVDRAGNPEKMPIKVQNAINKALLPPVAGPKKARKYTGNLRNDINLMAPGLYAEVARGGDGEGLDGFDMSLIAEQLRDEGFMLPTTETGKDSDAVIEIIRQDIANGGGTLNERRMTEAMTAEETRKHRQEVLRLADEYGVVTKNGIIARRLEEIEDDLATAIEAETDIAAKSLASIRDQAIESGMTENEVDAIADHFAELYDADTAKDKFVLMYRDAVNAIQERIDGNQGRQGRDEQGEGVGDDLPPAQGSEERPALELDGQTPADLRAEEERVRAEAAEEARLTAAERQARIDAEIASRQDIGADNFELGAQVNNAAEQRAIDKKRIDNQLAGQGNMFDAPANEAATKHENATAPEHVKDETGVTVAELKQIAKAFRDAVDGGEDADVTHVFDAPAKGEVVRLKATADAEVAKSGWLTPEQAKARVQEWRDNAAAQYDNDDIRSANSQKIVISLFDLTGKWSQPWEDAGYQVYRFDIQNGDESDHNGEVINIGDINNFSVDFFNDIFGSFDGLDVHAILAACPCTDFAVSGARHFAAKDADGRTVASIKLVKATLNTIEFFKPAVWALENPVGRIEDLTGLPPWRLSFDPYQLGDTYTKKTLIWGRFNADLPVAPVEPTEGSKMHSQYGGKSQATKNARSATPEGFAYGFFQANNAHDHPALAIAGKYDRLDRDLIERAVKAGITAEQIDEAVEDFYYQDLDDEAANEAIRGLLPSDGGAGKTEFKAGDRIEWDVDGAVATGTVIERIKTNADGSGLAPAYEVEVESHPKQGKYSRAAAPVASARAISEKIEAPADDFSAMFDDIAAEDAPVAPKPKKAKKPKADPLAAIREFYTPGNIIHVDYWKQHDKVLEFKEGDLPGQWSVKVIQVVKNSAGTWIPKDERMEPARWHSTTPGKDTIADRVVEAPKPKKPVTPQLVSNAQFESVIKIAADSVAQLRKADVERVITETPDPWKRGVAGRLKIERPDLAQEVDEVMAEAEAKRQAAPGADEVRKMGWDAFLDGAKRVVPSDLSVAGAKNWYQGWDAANLAAPVGEAPKPKSAIADIGALLGLSKKPGVSASEDFNEFTYLKIQPMFAAAIAEAGVVSDIKDSMRAVMNMVKKAYGAEALGVMKPYVVRYMQDVRDGKVVYDESAEVADNGLEQRSDTDLERDSQDAEVADDVGEESVRDGQRGAGRAGESGVQGSEGEGRPQRGGSLFGSDAPAPGERGDQSIYTGAGRSGIETSPAGGDDDSGGGDISLDGSPVEPNGADLFGELAESRVSLDEAKAKQKAADKLEHKPGLANIRETLPILLPGQQEDVHTAETRFAVPDGYGMLFTNGTGTGKTFTGLGIIKRFAVAGKGNIVIAVPSDKIASDWIKSGTMLGLDISKLEDTKDAGRGIVITTYANFGQNPALASRKWDLVVADEAHRLSMNAKGGDTLALDSFQALTMHPDGAYALARMLHGDIYARIAELQALAKSQRMSDDERNWHAENETQAKLKPLLEDIKTKETAIKAEIAAVQGIDRPRALFLTATPFAYEKSVEWANGYLFNYSEGKSDDGREFRGYNTGSNKDQFFMQHFGYRMRYGKLTEPDAKVDRGLMQRQFNTWLKRKGSLAGRMLDVKADYDRRFILTPSAIGARIDEALEWFEVKRKAGDARPALGELREKLAEQFTYLERRYLLEAVKAQEAIPHIREHLAMGRKVVVVHDYKKGGASNPFNISARGDKSPSADEFNDVLAEFKVTFKDLIEAEVWGAGAAIETIQAAFPNVLLFNGDVPKAQRQRNVEKFQDDASGPQVLLGLSHAMKEGISLHDTTGKHQRVLISLGQPTAPVDSIQIEGRIYRTGQVTDAIIRYLNTGTDWEKWAFATTIAQRASAAENLGMGEQARALKDAFIAGFEESDDYRAGMDGEGKGGKERDKAANAALTEYDRARAFYFGTQKKTAKTKAQEGTDYFATPEPVGLKMMEWADIRPGESVLEPSAGHGAIARWMPDTAIRTAIEPSMALRARLAMVFDGTMLDSNFEDLHTNNKYDAIVLNPPFGTAGRTAIDHVIKASKHLRDGGRIVALIPQGSADAKFDKWFYGEETRPAKPLGNTQRAGEYFVGDIVTLDGRTGSYRVVGSTSAGVEFAPLAGGQNELWRSHYIESVKYGPRTETFSPAEGLHLVAEIKLPAVTFERAGTKVSTRILVIEKGTNAPQQSNRDYSDIEDINELFDRMENTGFAPRGKPLETIPDTPAATPKGGKKAGVAAANEAAKEVDAQAQAAGLIAASSSEATFELKGDKIITNAPSQQYTTNAGKVIDGVIVPSQVMAKSVDKYTWKIKGHDGYFVRLRHIERPGLKAESTTASYGTKAVDINSPKFKRWFKGSEVTDESGLPLRLFHTTTAEFNEFAVRSDLGAHFGTAEQAAAFSKNEARSVPVYLSIKNPIRLVDSGDFAGSRVAPQLREMGLIDDKQMSDWISRGMSFESPVNLEIQEFLQSKGYDGAVYLNRREGPDFFGPDGFDGDEIYDMTDAEVIDNFPDAADSWIAFEPTQIKSAISNTGAFSGPLMVEETAYHGSPYLHSGFDSSKIGTGEGAQAYGWGHYFAGAKAVAEHYRNVLTGEKNDKRLTDDDVDTILQDPQFPVENAALDRIRETAAERDGITWAGVARAINSYGGNGAEYAQSVGERYWFSVEPTKGALYTVDLKPAEDEYLLWDKPLSRQSEKVRAAIAGSARGTTLDEVLAGKSVDELLYWVNRFDRNNSFAEWIAEEGVTSADEVRAAIIESYGDDEMADYLGNSGFADNRTGESIYRELSSKSGTDEAASKYLRSIGIRGIKYLDGSSRHTASEDWKVKTPSGLWHRFASKEAADNYIKGRAGYEITEPAANFNYVIFDDADIEIASVAERAEPAYGDTYDLFDTRPGTTDKQRDTGRAALDALERAERRIFGAASGVRGYQAAVLGSAISSDFRDNGGTSFVGQRVTTTGDLAMLGQAVRDPRFETFRVFYTDKAGKILGQGVYSSRLPGAVYLPEDFDKQIAADMAGFRASGYWMMHNHPSGRVEPSASDDALTLSIAKKVPGFAGHVILDHNQYATIDVIEGGYGMETKIDAVSAPELASKDLRANPEVPHAMLGEKINGPADLALAGKKLQVDPNVAVLVGVDASNKITLIVEVADWAINSKAIGQTPMKRMRALAAVRNAARQTGLSRIFAVVPGKLGDYFEATRLDFLTDVVDINGKSAAAQGNMNSSGSLPVTKANKTGLKARETTNEPIIDVKQSISSEKTSRKIVPASIRWGYENGLWVEGNTNFDIGSGKFDDMAEAMNELEIENLSYDPFWHSPADNRKAIAAATPAGADTVTVNNVLNVIKEQEARGQVIRQAAKALKPEGTALFLIYEGDKSGTGAETRDGYQVNAKAQTYVEDIREYFAEVRRSGAIIVAKNPIKRKTAGRWTPAEGQPAFSTVAPYGTRAVDTSSPEFKRWFGKSLVVGEDEGPQRMYHATYRVFDTFDPEKAKEWRSYWSMDNIGSWFSDRPEKAGMYAAGEGASIMPVYLSIQRPKVYDSFNDFLKEMHEANGSRYDENSAPGKVDPRPLKNKLTAQGYDAIAFTQTENQELYDKLDVLAEKLRQARELSWKSGKNDRKYYDGLVERTQRDITKTHQELRAFGNSTEFDGHYVWVAFNPEQIKSAISNTGEFSKASGSIVEASQAGYNTRQQAIPSTGATPPPPPTRQTPAPLQGGTPGSQATWQQMDDTKLDDVIRVLQDKHIDTKRAVQAIQAAGRQVADKWDPYLQETLFHGRAAKRTLEFVETELTPLAKDLAMRGLTMDELDEYLHARHAVEANAAIAQRNPAMPDGGSGMTNQAATDYLANLDPGKQRNLVAAAALVDAIIDKTRQTIVAYGLESQETIDAWTDAFDHYVPLMREGKDGNGHMGIGQGFSIKGKESKSRTGSTRKVVDILANIAMQRERAIVRGEKNRVSMSLFGLAKLNPNTDFWTTDKIPVIVGLNPATGLVEAHPDPLYKSRDNVIVAKFPDGKGGVVERAVVFKEDNEQAMNAVAAMKNLDTTQLEGLLGSMASITRYFAAVNTQWNPVFGVTNFVRDFQDAALNLSSTPIAGHKAAVLKGTFGALAGIYVDTRKMRKGAPATSPWAQLWEEFQHEGGQTGYRDLYRTSEDRAKQIANAIDPNKWMDSALGKIFTAGGMLRVPLKVAQAKATWLFDWLSDYNEAMENAVRLSAYKVGRDQGMSKQRAAEMAKGLTVNFNRKGQVTQHAGMLYAFFNASVQGTGRIAQTVFTIQGNDAKTIRLSRAGSMIVGGGILLGSMQALMLAAMGFGDDEPPEFVRERNTIIPIGNKQYITIPMPLGFMVLPNIGRVATEFAMGGFKNPAKHALRLLGIMADAFNPVGGNGTIAQMVSPTALDPLVAISENKDWTKKPIAKVAYDKTTPGHKLWKDTASTPSKMIAEAINSMSGGNKHVAGALSPTPDQIDYLFGQVTGGVGRELSKLEQSITATARGEDLPPHKIPLVGRFYGDSGAQTSQGTTFYNNINRINEYEAQIKGLRQERKGAEAAQFIRDNPEARLVMRANYAERQVQKLRKEKHDLVDQGAPRERVKALEERIKGEMLRFNEVVKASKQRQKEAA